MLTLSVARPRPYAPRVVRETLAVYCPMGAQRRGQGLQSGRARARGVMRWRAGCDVCGEVSVKCVPPGSGTRVRLPRGCPLPPSSPPSGLQRLPFCPRAYARLFLPVSKLSCHVYRPRTTRSSTSVPLNSTLFRMPPLPRQSWQSVAPQI